MSATATPLVETPTDWREQLPSEIRSDPSLKDIKDIAGLGKSYVSAQKMLGTSLRVPAADAKQEDWDGLHAKLGRPEKPEGYKITRPSLPDNMRHDEEFETMLRASSHGAGLNDRQLQRIVDDHAKFSIKRATDAQQQMQEETEGAVNALKQEWGGSYDRRIGLALTAVKQFGGAKLQAELKDSMGNHPELIRAFANIGEKLIEQGLVTGDSPSRTDEKTALDKEKAELYAGPLKPGLKQNSDYRQSVERLTAINQRLLEIEGAE